jgi:uncharacterized protein (TIGR03545 family)
MRWKGIIVFGIIVLALVIFSIFFMDNLIKGTIESVGSNALGAKLDIKEFELSFSKLLLRISGLQIGDPQDEWRNQAEIGEIKFNLDFGALLRKKFIIEEVLIEGVTPSTKRTVSGKMTQSSQATQATSALNREQNALMKEIESIPAIQMLKDDKKINTDSMVTPEKITAPKEIKKAEDEVEARNKNATSVIDKLDANKRIEAIQKELSQINLKEKDPKKLGKELKKLKEIKSDITKLKNEINQAENTAKGDINFMDEALKNVDRLKENDYQNIIKTISEVKGADKENIGKLILGPVWMERADMLLNYFGAIKSLLPEKATEPEKLKKITGMDVTFPRDKNYPGFLIKLISLSSGRSGKPEDLVFEGKITDICSEPAFYGKPIVISMKGTRPNFDLDGNLDYTGEIGKDTVKMMIRDLDLKDFSLSQSSLLPKKIASGKASIAINFNSLGEKIDCIMVITVKGLSFLQEDIAPGELANEIARTLSSTSELKIEGKIYGTFKDIKTSVTSNVDELLSASIKGLVDKRMETAKQKIRQKLDLMVDGQKGDLVKKIQSNKDGIGSKLKNNRSGIEQLESQIK